MLGPDVVPRRRDADVRLHTSRAHPHVAPAQKVGEEGQVKHTDFFLLVHGGNIDICAPFSLAYLSVFLVGAWITILVLSVHNDWTSNPLAFE